MLVLQQLKINVWVLRTLSEHRKLLVLIYIIRFTKYIFFIYIGITTLKACTKKDFCAITNQLLLFFNATPSDLNKKYEIS